MDQIKLVIWDLDDTFWRGTLSEGEVTPVEENIDLIKRLVDRGIMNSIASKNDAIAAAARLKELEVWDYFIFPVIDWVPKAQMVSEIVENVQLRPENIAFIDDNPTNLAEVSFQHPGLRVNSPEVLSGLLLDESLSGKDDRSHSRLKQYKLLEHKHEQRRNFMSNEEFLTQAQIKIGLIENVEPLSDRIQELIERTNQLNFTQKRLSPEDLTQRIDGGINRNLAVVVQDRYGDYGVSGFASLNLVSNRLEHFLFSCRVMHMGVEQFIYHHLGCPELDGPPEKTAALLGSQCPQWISLNLSPDSDASLKARLNGQAGPAGSGDGQVDRPRILMKGSCESRIIGSYLDNLAPHLDVAVEVIPIVHNSHSVVIRDSLTQDRQLLQDILADFPELHPEHYDTDLFAGNHDLVILNLSMDACQTLYRKKGTSVRVPWLCFENLLARSEDFVVRELAWKHKGTVDAEFFRRFRENYECAGRVSLEEHLDNLRFIREQVKAPIIFINETNLIRRKLDDDQQELTHKRTLEMNDILDKFVGEYKDTYLFDLRRLVTRPEQIASDNVHFDRQTYFQMTELLISQIDKILKPAKTEKESRPQSFAGKCAAGLRSLSEAIRSRIAFPS